MTKLRSECFCNSHESFFATELGVKKGVIFLEAYLFRLCFLIFKFKNLSVLLRFKKQWPQFAREVNKLKDFWWLL